jgi:hypothetical protein
MALTPASKYSNVRAAASAPAPRPGAVQGPRSKVQGPKSQGQSPAIFVPRLGKQIPLEQWYWKELREGGMLRRYLQAEKALSVRRQRAVAKKMHGFQQNNKSDWRLKAAVPAREFFRWQAEDPDFWSDDNNLRSLKRDNPDMVIHV